MEAYEETQDLYKECGKFTAKYFEDKELYGESSGENHPVMQQYFLLMHEWAATIRDVNIEKIMLEKYTKVSELNSKPSTAGKKSIFMLEAKFQELQYLYYQNNKVLCNSTILRQKIQEMDELQFSNGLSESQ